MLDSGCGAPDGHTPSRRPAQRSSSTRPGPLLVLGPAGSGAPRRWCDGSRPWSHAASAPSRARAQPARARAGRAARARRGAARPPARGALDRDLRGGGRGAAARVLDRGGPRSRSSPPSGRGPARDPARPRRRAAAAPARDPRQPRRAARPPAAPHRPAQGRGGGAGRAARVGGRARARGDERGRARARRARDRVRRALRAPRPDPARGGQPRRRRSRARARQAAARPRRRRRGGRATRFRHVLVDELEDAGLAHRPLLAERSPATATSSAPATRAGGAPLSRRAARRRWRPFAPRYPDARRGRPRRRSLREPAAWSASGAARTSAPRRRRSPARSSSCSPPARSAPSESASIAGSGWREGRLVAAALEERSVPFRFAGDAAFFGRPEVRDALAWLRMLADPDDAAAVVRALTRPPVDLRSVDLAKVTTIARRRKLDMVSALEAALESPQLPPEARDRIQAFLRLQRAAASALEQMRADVFVRRLIERVGLRRQRLFAASPETAERLVNLSRLAELADRLVAPRAARLGARLRPPPRRRRRRRRGRRRRLRPARSPARCWSPSPSRSRGWSSTTSTCSACAAARSPRGLGGRLDPRRAARRARCRSPARS